MKLKNINFVGFVKLNMLLIYFPMIISNVLWRVTRGITGQFPTQETQTTASITDILIWAASTFLYPLMLVYFLAKVIHFLAQHTKIGDIKIGVKGD